MPFVKGQRVRASDKYPYGWDRTGTILRVAGGEQPSQGLAYMVQWDGVTSQSAWHENFLTEETAEESPR